MDISDHKRGLRRFLAKDFHRNKMIYLMLLPIVLYYALFYYAPMYGIQIAFKNFSPGRGILHSPWVGLEHFKAFWDSYYFGRIIRNTLLISFYDLLFAFPAPIVLALLFNELRSTRFKRLVQSITYLPHFISIVVVVGLLLDFLSSDGLVNQWIEMLGGETIPFLQSPSWFRTLYVSSGIWQSIGWSSIIYLAAISGIDPTLYEAAKVDGAGRFRQMYHITLAGIMPTIVILLILRMGALLAVSDEKILLMYNPLTYSTADVIGTFVYRKGLVESNYSFSAAIGLIHSVLNFLLLVLANQFSKRLGGARLW